MKALLLAPATSRMPSRCMDDGRASQTIQRDIRPVGSYSRTLTAGLFSDHQHMVLGLSRIAACMLACFMFSLVAMGGGGIGGSLETQESNTTHHESGVAADSQAGEISSAFESLVAHVAESYRSGDVEVSWKYVNRLDFPLVVERFEESCVCLRGRPDNNEVAPGAGGTIRAIFNAGQHRGTVRKSLHVRFAGHDKPVELVAEARIPSSVALSSQELVWKSGEPSSGQVIDVTAGTSAAFQITDLRGPTLGEFSIERSTITEGRHYRLTVTPLSPAAGVRCLQIHTNSPDPRDRLLAVFLNHGTSGAAPSKNLPISPRP